MTFIKTFFRRLGDLVIKLVAVKTVAAVVVTAVYVFRAEALGFLGFYAVVAAWIAMCGARTIEKYLNLFPKKND